MAGQALFSSLLGNSLGPSNIENMLSTHKYAPPNMTQFSLMGATQNYILLYTLYSMPPITVSPLSSFPILSKYFFSHHSATYKLNYTLFKNLQLLKTTEKAMVTHSSTLAWKIPWMEEPRRLQSMGLRRVGHDWATSLSLFTFIHWRRKWQPTPVSLPGESQGRGSLVGCRLWGRTESEMTEAT